MHFKTCYNKLKQRGIHNETELLFSTDCILTLRTNKCNVQHGVTFNKSHACSYAKKSGQKLFSSPLENILGNLMRELDTPKICDCKFYQKNASNF